MMRRKQTFSGGYSIPALTTLAWGRLLLGISLSLSLLWTVQPLFAGQRRRGLSGDQVISLQKQATSRRQLQALYVVIMQYAADYDGRLPSLGSPAKLRDQLKEYRLRTSALVCPFTNKEYLSNKNLAGKKLDAVSKPATLLLFWSPKSMQDGHYLVLDASGLDRRVTAAVFGKMKRSSGIK